MGATGSITADSVDLAAFKRAKVVYEGVDKNNTSNATMVALIEEALHAATGAETMEEDPALRKERNERFLTACGKYEKGGKGANLERAEALFNQGVDVDFGDEDGCTALIHASGEGEMKVVKFLTDEANVSIDVQSSDGTTALWTAAFNGQTEVVNHLLLCGADERIKGQPLDEPLQSPALAARRNRKPGLADLIDAEASLREQNPERREAQKARQMDVEEYRASLRAASKQVQAPA